MSLLSPLRLLIQSLNRNQKATAKFQTKSVSLCRQWAIVWIVQIVLSGADISLPNSVGFTFFKHCLVRLNSNSAHIINCSLQFKSLVSFQINFPFVNAPVSFFSYFKLFFPNYQLMSTSPGKDTELVKQTSGRKRIFWMAHLGHFVRGRLGARGSLPPRLLWLEINLCSYFSIVSIHIW